MLEGCVCVKSVTSVKRKRKKMESTTLQKKVDLQELNHSDSQMLQIDSILQRLQFKIPSINRLNVTESLNEYITQINM